MINLSALRDLSRAKKYAKNAVIAGENEACGLVIVMRGVAGVYAGYGGGKKELVSTIGPGGVFGETALCLGRGAPHTLAALTDVIVLQVENGDAIAFIRQEPETAFEIMKDLCARLEGAGAPRAQKAAPPAETAGVQNAPAPAPAAEPPPAPAAKAPAPGQPFPLFPEGHGSYELTLNSEDRTYLMEKGLACPMCKKEFRALSVRASRLVQESSDKDMRHRYRGVEPLYYDVVTCPHCLYSALAESFGKPDNLRADLSELQAMKDSTAGMFGTAVSVDSVFAGYYLALLCAPKCFAKHQWATAKLLMKLSRVYQDCGDAAMEGKTAKLALDAYLYIYLNEQSDPNQDQQLCIVLGELYLKLADMKNAREYFFRAKTNRMGSPVLKTHAETRLSDIKALEGNS